MALLNGCSSEILLRSVVFFLCSSFHISSHFNGLTEPFSNVVTQHLFYKLQNRSLSFFFERTCTHENILATGLICICCNILKKTVKYELKLDCLQTMRCMHAHTHMHSGETKTILKQSVCVCDLGS